MTGKVITIAQQKGGAGKTTLAAHLAIAWAARHRVGVLDIDPQASLSTWFGHRGELQGAGGNAIEVSALAGWRVTGEIERQQRNRDIVLIDSPPHAELESRLAVRAARLVLVPVQPSPMDLWATKPTIELARAEKVPVLLVLNRVPARANLTGLMLDAFNALGVPMAETQIGNRVAFAASLAEGKGIHEFAPSSAAAEEIAALAAEVLAQAA